MAVESRSELKKHFQTGMIPTEGDFGNLIDSFVHKSNNEVRNALGSPLRIDADPSDLRQIIETYDSIAKTNVSIGLSGNTEDNSGLKFYRDKTPKFSINSSINPYSEESSITLHESNIKGLESSNEHMQILKRSYLEMPYHRNQSLSINNGIFLGEKNKREYWTDQNIVFHSNIDTGDERTASSVTISARVGGLNWGSASLIRLGTNTHGREIPSIEFYVEKRMMVITKDQIQSKGTIAPTLADFAELFESRENIPIPTGTSVAVDTNGKIRSASPGEIPIGVISANPAILGNSADEWPKKYLRDDFGTPIMGEIEEEIADDPYTSEMPGNTTSAAPRKIKVMRPKLNPDYDPAREYTPRRDRPEWHAVGLLGQLPLLKGQPVAPTWVKIKDISETVELWLVK